MRRIEAAEIALREMGFSPVRCRAHGDLARVEVEQTALSKALDLRETITQKLKALGFTYVTLDLQGFRSGAMDEQKA